MYKYLISLLIVLFLFSPAYAKKKKSNYSNTPQSIQTVPVLDVEVMRSHDRLYQNRSIEVTTHRYEEFPYIPPFPFFKLSEKKLNNREKK